MRLIAFIQKLEADPKIISHSKVIEEKVSIEYDDKQDIAYIKGVDENYTQVVRIDTALVAGNYFDFETPYQILTSDGVARRLREYSRSGPSLGWHQVSRRVCAGCHPVTELSVFFLV